MPRRVLLDTSFIIALENRSDRHHERAKELDRQLLGENAELLLHWGIMLEIADGYARIGRRAKGCQLLERFEQEYDVRPITQPIFTDAVTLYKSRADKEWSLTDCVSFVLMGQAGMIEALTADGHFRQAGFVALLLETT